MIKKNMFISEQQCVKGYIEVLKKLLGVLKDMMDRGFLPKVNNVLVRDK